VDEVRRTCPAKPEANLKIVELRRPGRALSALAFRIRSFESPSHNVKGEAGNP